MTHGSRRDEARQAVAARGLTPAAVAHLTRDALGDIDFAALGPVKQHLKRFFSDQPWTADCDDGLAQLVGPGEGWWRHDLDQEFELEFGWRNGAFRIDVAPRHEPGETFAGPVVPEATPNPRTIRFVTPPIHDGPSRWYESEADADDPRVARLFADFDDIANVLVGPTFVAVGLRRPDRWEELLDPVLRVISADFASGASDRPAPDGPGTDPTGAAEPAPAEHAREGERALERAWKELGTLRAAEPGDLDRIIAAVSSPNTADRQVAARVLADADPEVAEREWTRLLGDSRRSVRRATVDAMVDAERPALRALFERALGDDDAWTRWKALRGLADLGIAASRTVVSPLTEDPDFRVRLEAAGALRDGSP